MNAKTEHAKNIAEIERQIARLAELIAERKATTNPNWCNVGDLARVLHNVTEINDQMAGVGDYAL